MTDYAEEIRLLVSLIGGEAPSNITNIDVERFLNLVKFHHLESFVSSKLCDLSVGDPFKETTDALDGAQLTYKAHLIALRHGFREAIALFSAAAIPSIVLKGLYLSECVYPPGMARRFADLDFLVSEADFARAEGALLDHGFEPIPSYHSRFETEDCARLGISRPFFHKKAHYLQIDLHNRLSIGPGRRFLRPEDCWLSAKDVLVEGLSVKVLPDESCFLHLCWHALKHSFCRLIWFFDVYYFYKAHGQLIEDEGFQDFVAGYGGRKIVGTSLGLSASVFNDRALQDYTERNFAESKVCGKGYFSLEELLQPRQEISSLRRIHRDFSLLTGIEDRFKYLANSLFPDPRLLPDLSPEVKTRWDRRYLGSRLRTVFSSNRAL